MLITALHHAGLVCLIHTPNPMKFLNDLCQRPNNEKPVMIIPVGYPSASATIPQAAKKKKPLGEILSVFQAGLRPKNSIGFRSVSRQYRAGGNFADKRGNFWPFIMLFWRPELERLVYWKFVVNTDFLIQYILPNPCHLSALI